MDAGARLVGDAGATMRKIVASVKKVNDIIDEISSAGGQQSDGIAEVSGAVTALDRKTQQNAVLVEQSAAAAKGLREQASRLAQTIGRSRLHAT